VRLQEPLPPAQVEPVDDVLALLTRLYEENIGAITRILADELRDAAERYRHHPQWIEWAFREAIRQNRRRWSYVQAILQRWEAEGPDHEALGRDTKADWFEQRYIRGKGRN
jgi:DnaD/phage-associated family protein